MVVGNAQREISFTETKFIIGIVDNSNSEISRSLTDYLGKKNINNIHGCR